MEIVFFEKISKVPLIIHYSFFKQWKFQSFEIMASILVNMSFEIKVSFNCG